MRDDQKNPEHETHGDATVDAPSVTDDRLYRSLASRERRRLLFVLLDREQASVGELARLLVGWEATEGGPMSTPEDYRKARTELVHHHLPMLDDSRLVEYDSGTGVVRARAVDPVVRALVRQSVVAHSR